MKKEIKKILREEINKNILGVVITKPDQELYIMRGIPGSGKSTLANTLVNEGVIHSTDMLIESTGDYNGHFNKMVETGDWSPHTKMHRKNYLNAKESMIKGLTPIIIDNTCIKANEAKKYVVEALKLGYDDKNIKIFDVGDGGCDANTLAERNTHSVPLETIKKMLASHKGVGELTVKKILESKDMSRTINFVSLVLDDKSKSTLLSALGHKIPNEWTVYAHHMTISFAPNVPEEIKNDIGLIKKIRAVSIGRNDMSIAVGVEDYFSTNEKPHITLGVNTLEGGKPVMSNKITEWVKLENYINLSGVVTVQTYN